MSDLNTIWDDGWKRWWNPNLKMIEKYLMKLSMVQWMPRTISTLQLHEVLKWNSKKLSYAFPDTFPDLFLENDPSILELNIFGADAQHHDVKNAPNIRLKPHLMEGFMLEKVGWSVIYIVSHLATTCFLLHIQKLTFWHLKITSLLKGNLIYTSSKNLDVFGFKMLGMSVGFVFWYQKSYHFVGSKIIGFFGTKVTWGHLPGTEPREFLEGQQVAVRRLVATRGAFAAICSLVVAGIGNVIWYRRRMVVMNIVLGGCLIFLGWRQPKNQTQANETNEPN